MYWILYSNYTKFEVKKKRAKAINEIKENMRSVLEKTKGCKYYDKYVKGFNQLFKVISDEWINFIYWI